MKNLLLLSMAVIVAASTSLAEVGPGKPAPDFSLEDTTGTTHSLHDFEGEYVVLEWTNYDCPFVKKHYSTGNMQALQKEFTDKGVIWLSINSSALGKQGNFPPQKWNKLIQAKEAAPTAVLLDPTGRVGRMYGAKTTPHMFVINPEGILIYGGAIDDNSSFDPKTVEGASNYVRAALEQAMAGEEVEETWTVPYGCSVKY
jgi:peroxiredoxin